MSALDYLMGRAYEECHGECEYCHEPDCEHGKCACTGGCAVCGTTEEFPYAVDDRHHDMIRSLMGA